MVPARIPSSVILSRTSPTIAPSKRLFFPNTSPSSRPPFKVGSKPARCRADFQVRAADGRTLWLESAVMPSWQMAVPTHLRGLTIDITARQKKNEEALVASEPVTASSLTSSQAIWMARPTAASPTPTRTFSTTSA